jgi:hypothetical protein
MFYLKHSEGAPYNDGASGRERYACVDGIEVFPATTRVLDMVPDDPSTWLYRCHVNEGIDNRMEVLFLRSDLQIVLALLAKSQTLIDNNNSTG